MPDDGIHAGRVQVSSRRLLGRTPGGSLGGKPNGQCANRKTQERDAQAKIKELIDSRGETKDVIDMLKRSLKLTHRNSIIENAFTRYDSNLSADEALEFSAALRAYQHEMSERTVREDYRAMVHPEDRKKEYFEMFNVLYHPEHSLQGVAKDTGRVAPRDFKPAKYKSTPANDNVPLRQAA